MSVEKHGLHGEGCPDGDPVDGTATVDAVTTIEKLLKLPAVAKHQEFVDALTSLLEMLGNDDAEPSAEAGHTEESTKLRRVRLTEADAAALAGIRRDLNEIRRDQTDAGQATGFERTRLLTRARTTQQSVERRLNDLAAATSPVSAEDIRRSFGTTFVERRDGTSKLISEAFAAATR